MKSLGNSLFVIIVFMLLGSSCSQTKRLTEGEVLYTGVKKMNIETAKGVKLEGPKSSAISGPLGTRLITRCMLLTYVPRFRLGCGCIIGT